MEKIDKETQLLVKRESLVKKAATIAEKIIQIDTMLAELYAGKDK